MRTLTPSSASSTVEASFATPAWSRGVLLVLCWAVGLLGILPAVFALTDMWTQDPLKSVGMWVPLASLLLILRAWRSIGWSGRGTWWGLALVAAVYVLIHLREQMLLTLVLTPRYAMAVPPVSLTVFGYLSGVVLLMGGTRLYRAALFPVVLILLVNPVPHFFTNAIDLPLQEASAHVARSFAVTMGQPLNDASLRLMFTPKFGMFIAPGCDGIRGAITMGLIAAVAGYMLRFRAGVHAAVIAGAVMLGYICNFLRLCLLVVYYIIALHFTGLQRHGTMADYIIGGCLFLSATFLFVTALMKLKSTRSALRPVAMSAAQAPQQSVPRTLQMAGAMLLVTLIAGVGYARAWASEMQTGTRGPSVASVALLPERVGAFHQTRSWVERYTNGPVTYFWGEYQTDDGNESVRLGVGPGMGAHDATVCHTARGEKAAWRGAQNFATANGSLATLASLYKRESAQTLEVSTVCSGGQCGAYGSSRRYLSLDWSRPAPHAFFRPDPSRPMPVLVLARTADTSLSPAEAVHQMGATVENFLSSADVSSMTAPFRDAR